MALQRIYGVLEALRNLGLGEALTAFRDVGRDVGNEIYQRTPWRGLLIPAAIGNVGAFLIFKAKAVWMNALIPAVIGSGIFVAVEGAKDLAQDHTVRGIVRGNGKMALGVATVVMGIFLILRDCGCFDGSYESMKEANRGKDPQQNCNDLLPSYQDFLNKRC